MHYRSGSSQRTQLLQKYLDMRLENAVNEIYTEQFMELLLYMYCICIFCIFQWLEFTLYCFN